MRARIEGCSQTLKARSENANRSFICRKTYQSQAQEQQSDDETVMSSSGELGSEHVPITVKD